MTSFDHLPKFLAAAAREFCGLFIRHQFLRYLLVGVGNTAFSYGTYAALLLVGLDYRIASLLALVLGIAFSFITQGAVVFRNATSVTLVKFVVAWSLIYIFNIWVIALLMRVSMSAYLAGAVAIVPVTLISYVILKFAVFGRRVPARRANPFR